MARDSVVRAALELLDEVGLDGLSVRRLAAVLGVRNPALYWHFRNKQELLDEMSRALLAPGMGGPRDGETWQEWLTRRAVRYRRVLLSHRDGARLVAGSNPGPGVARAFEEELRVLTGLGFTPGQALHTIATVSHYTTGFVLNEQAGRPHGGEVDLEELPLLVAGVHEGGPPGGDAAFAFGLRAIVAGVTAALDGSGRP
ncbi:MAG: TetR family transcriptional regulator [Thermoactinospora sp.]|nr:TetR family transcriptional regulator [Thermoactinospora sp.]